MRQVKQALTWIKSFLRKEQGEIERVWSVKAFLSSVHSITMAFDASPWGLGAVLVNNAIPIVFFACKLDAFDTRRYGYNLGDSKGQQCWEALCILVALRLWYDEWAHGRCTLLLKREQCQRAQSRAHDEGSTRTHEKHCEIIVHHLFFNAGYRPQVG